MQEIEGARPGSKPKPDGLAARGRAGGTALMLAGGGARAAYQAGVLSLIGRRRPELRIPILTGVSAGAINVGYLAAHPEGLGQAAAGLTRRWQSLTTEEVFRSDPLSMLRIAIRWIGALVTGGVRLTPRARGLVDTDPLRDFLDRSIPATGIEENLRAGRVDAVAMSALSYQTGRTVTFVQNRGPLPRTTSVHHRVVRAKLSIDHVMASAAIPLLFPAVKVGQQWYGDGSFRYVAPLSPAIHLGAERILTISGRYGQSGSEARQPELIGYPPPARIIGLLFNSVFLDTLDGDASRLRRVNRLLREIPEERRGEVGVREVDLLIIRPSRDLGRLATEYEGRLPQTLRFFVRGLGSPQSRSADFVSYLLFESAYISRLIELGERDAEHEWPRIREFLERGSASRAVAALP